MEHGTCRSCGAAIIWVRTRRGKRMPLNQEYADGGNIVIDDDDLAVVVGEDEPGHVGKTRYTSHFATCPNAARHRRAV